MKMLVIVVLLVTCHITQSDVEIGKDIDYSDLAGEAEINKKNLLSFLNGNEITNKYRERYNNLLNKLEDNEPVKNRRESTRRIVSGRNTSISAVPWQVSLREKSYPICGGSVLTDIWIISAAHCLLRFKAMDLSVRVGSSWKTHGGEIYDVKESFVHPNYIGKQKINDVGLVRLHTALRFSSRVLPIKLVTRDANLPAGVPAIVSGWGNLKEGGPSTTNLQSSTVKTIAMKLCRWSGLNRKTIDPASMFCAGSFLHLSPDTCQGDSGGPIVYDGVLIGVVSWGLGCARGNFPGVYSRLSYPLIWDWVHKHIMVKNDNKTML